MVSQTNKSNGVSSIERKDPQPLRVPAHHVNPKIGIETADESETPNVPARILNKFVYCPTLPYLMWVQKEWQASSHTIDGKREHKKVDKVSGSIAEPTSPDDQPKVARSVELSSDTYRLASWMG